MPHLRLPKLSGVVDRAGWQLGLLTVGFCAVSMFSPATALSQTSLDATADVAQLDEIIVTARKVEESVQDVPMSVQVLSAELLDQLDL